MKKGYLLRVNTCAMVLTCLLMLPAMGTAQHDELAIGLPPRAGQCPGEYVTFAMDDEDDDPSGNWGGTPQLNYLGARDSNGGGSVSYGAPRCYAGLCKTPPRNRSGFGKNTSYTFCKTTVTGSLPTLYTDYFVLKLDAVCPEGSKEFLRHWDNEDDSGSTNAQYGTAADGPAVNYTTVEGRGHSELSFCWVRGTYNLGTPIVPEEWASKFALLIGSADGVPNGYSIVYGVQDDEDRQNENMYIFYGDWTAEEQQRVRLGLDHHGGGHNTYVRMLWK